METMLVLVNPTDYGLQATEAAKVEAAFVPMLNKMKELEDEFNEVVLLPIEPTTMAMAKALRLKYVKIRTGCAEIHRKEKAFYLAGGKFVDGWKNAQLYASQGKEEKLEEIEKHYERIEAERRTQLKIERLSQLDGLCEDPEIYGVENMFPAQFKQLRDALTIAKQQKEDAAKKTKEDRIAQEKADDEMRSENERLKAEAIENERVAAIERKKQEDALAAERAKAEAERKSIEDAARKEREAAESIAKAEAARQAKILAEQKAKAEAELRAVEEKNRVEREFAEKKAAAERAETERIRKELESMITCPNCKHKFHLQK
jgi:hypothetical protein